jgi:lysophospholipase L1-like esterase
MRILCFGDSYTQGVVPGGEVGFEERFGVNVRWPGQLHQKLGPGFEILEEGLMGRVTDFDDPNRIGKNGLAYLHPCLESHKPLDIVILMLGTNDCKERYHRQPEDITAGVHNLLSKISSLVPQAKILLMSPPLIDETAPGIKVRYLGAEIKSEL